MRQIKTSMFKFVGSLITIAASAVALIAGYFTLPPNIILEEVKNKSSSNIESRLLVRNKGIMPAQNIYVDVKDMDILFGTNSINISSGKRLGIPTKKLSYHELLEIPACPHIRMPPGTNLKKCTYDLLLKYELRFFSYHKNYKKHWHIELRNSNGEFTWQATLR